MSFSRFRKTIDLEKLNKILILYGIVLIVCNIIAIVSYYIVYKDSQFALSWGDFDSLMMIIAGIAILANKKRTILSALGSSAMAIAIGKLPNIIDYMTVRNIGLGVSSTVMFLVGVVSLVLAVNLFYTGVMYYAGLCRGYFWHMVSISILALWDLYLAMIEFVSVIQGGDSVRAFQCLFVNIQILIVYLLYIYLLNHDIVRSSMQIEKINDRLVRIGTHITPEKDTAISRDDAELLINGPDAWPTIVPYGPVIAEIKILFSHTNSESYCTVQKWAGDDRLFFTVTDTDDGTVIEAARFSSVMISTDTDDIRTCTKLILYDRNGIDRVIPVFDPTEESI